MNASRFWQSAACFALAAACLPGQESAGPKVELDAALSAGAANQSLGFLTHPNQLRLTEATLSLSAGWDRIAFRIDGGAGDFYPAAMASDSWKGLNQQLSQAYLIWKPRAETRIEAGKFFSSVGAEVPQSYLNFNTTRSLLFWYAEPLYHAGVRFSTPLTAAFSVGAQLLSGCNTIAGSHGHQTVALTAAWTGKRWSWSEIYLDGNQKLTGSGRRHLSNTVLTFHPWRPLTGYLEGIAVLEKRATPGYSQWHGCATAWKVSPLEKWSFSPRLDWLHDPDGATTGTAQRLFEFTLTGEYRPRKSLLARLEYRRDWSSCPFFPRAAGLPPSRRQTALVAGMTFLLHRER